MPVLEGQVSIVPMINHDDTYDLIPPDTTVEAYLVQHEILARMSMEDRARMTLQLCANVREIAMAGIRDRHPEYNDEQVKLALIDMLYGESLNRD